MEHAFAIAAAFVAGSFLGATIGGVLMSVLAMSKISDMQDQIDRLEAGNGAS
jgi:hypothetical protein